MCVGVFASANRLKFLLHAVCYYACIIVAVAYGVWEARGPEAPDESSSARVERAFLFVALVMLAWVKLAGDVEEKSNITIFLSSTHRMDV